jgi:hypothetical protein
MRDEAMELAARQGGVVLRRQLTDLGGSGKEVDALLRSKQWCRLRRGGYATAAAVEAATRPEDHHLLLARLVLLAVDQPTWLSHQSAALAHQLPLIGRPPDDVQVTRDTLHAARNEAGVRHHRGTLPEDERALANGLPATSVPRTVLDVARTASFSAAVVAADAARYRGLTTHGELLRQLERMATWPGARQAGRVVAACRAGAQTPGESLLRLDAMQLGMPEPVLQFRIIDVDGTLIAVTDMAFVDLRVVSEFDGRLKYRVAPGMTAEQASQILGQEKDREDGIRRLGWAVARFGWNHLGDLGYQRRAYLQACEVAGVTPPPQLLADAA